MIGRLGGIPDLSERLDKPLRMLTEAHGAKGPLALLPKQPWGGVLTVVDNMEWYTYAFFPVTDIVPLVELAKIQWGCEVKEDDGVYRIPLGENTVYAVRKGKWAYFANSPRTLLVLPANPAALLGDLPQRYDLAARLSLKNLTPEYRAEIVPRLREAVQLGMDRMVGESEDPICGATRAGRSSRPATAPLIDDFDYLLLGWNLDAKKEKNTYLDLEVTAKGGTKLADRFAQIKSGKSRFAALLSPDAAFSAGSIGTLTNAQAAQIGGALADLRKSAARQLAKQGLSAGEVKTAGRFLDNLLDVVQKTLKNKKTDAALSLGLDSQGATLLAGALLADGATLDESLRQLADDWPKDDKIPAGVKVRAETYKGMALYAVSLPTPDRRLTSLVGKTLDVAVAVAGDKLLVAAGRDAVANLRKAFDQLQHAPAQEVPPLRIRLAVPAMAKIVALTSKNQQIRAAAAMLAGFSANAGSKNHVSFTVTPIPGGVRARLEVEEGLLKVLGSLSQLMGLINPNSF